MSLQGCSDFFRGIKIIFLYISKVEIYISRCVNCWLEEKLEIYFQKIERGRHRIHVTTSRRRKEIWEGIRYYPIYSTKVGVNRSLVRRKKLEKSISKKLKIGRD
jgi:hypothetical protein